MNIYVISQEKHSRNTAGSKAPADITKIALDYGCIKQVFPPFPHEKSIIYQKFWLFFFVPLYWISFLKKLCKDDIVIYQHPMYGNRITAKIIPLFQKKGIRFIAVIHDLESLRGGISGVVNVSKKTSKIADITILKACDVIICHNEKMKNYLTLTGITPNKLITLKIFDYLCPSFSPTQTIKNNPSIAIAGNLAAGKSNYLYQIMNSNKNQSLTIHLYGNNFQQERSAHNIIYHGSFSPDDLPNYLEGDFGLVWDGFSLDSCTGNTGEYLKYNNPHKTSLYLAAGIPVIVWSQAAIADFIMKNNVGIPIDNLNSLADTIRNLSNNEYLSMRTNAKALSIKIRSGFFFTQALEIAIKKLEE